jgi:hypothetical protein
MNRRGLEPEGRMGEVILIEQFEDACLRRLKGHWSRDPGGTACLEQRHGTCPLSTTAISQPTIHFAIGFIFMHFRSCGRWRSPAQFALYFMHTRCRSVFTDQRNLPQTRFELCCLSKVSSRHRTYSGLIFACSITPFHFRVSAATKSRISAGELPTARRPISSNRARTSSD